MSGSAGNQPFKWFIGVVEDVENDPRKLGRVQVRIVYQDNDEVDTKNTPWCSIMMPTTSEAYHGIGDTPRFQVGTNVVGFYADGDQRSFPVIIGSMAIVPEEDDDKNSLPWLARGKQIIEKNVLGPEPPDPYNAKYPHNRVIKTKSGHTIELDDTPDNERVHIYHKAGTYIEIDKEGRLSIRTTGDSYEVVEGDKHVYVEGNMFVQVKGDQKTIVEGAITQTTKKTAKIVAAEKLDLSGKTGIKIQTKNDVAVKARGGLNTTESGITAMGPIASVSGISGIFTTGTGQQIQVTKGIVSNITRTG